MWKTYAKEFITVCLGISLAFYLDRWAEERRDRQAELKILTEIRNGLMLDLSDAEGNQKGHKDGLKSIEALRRWSIGASVSPDTMRLAFNRVLRSFIAVQNSTAYEALKSRGLETITNDSLRYRIIALYDFDYEILEKLEESYSEVQFSQQYNATFERIMNPHLIFDTTGKLTGVRMASLSMQDRQTLFTVFYRVGGNRQFLVRQYDDILERIRLLISSIDRELAARGAPVGLAAGTR